MEENNCCGDAQNTISGCSCSCGFLEYPDQSEVSEPETPSTTASREFLSRLEDYARSLGIASMGYASITPEVILAGDFKYKNAVVLTLKMDDELIGTPPREEAQAMNDRLYDELADLTFRVSDYLRENGYGAVAIHPMSGLLDLTSLAQNAGIGFKGTNGLLIGPETGPAQKVSAVLTSISNLPQKASEHSWIPEYCARCGKCIKACPEDALVEVDTCCGSTVLLLEDRCLGCSEGCTYCIESCPFYSKGYETVRSKFMKLRQKLEERGKL